MTRQSKNQRRRCLRLLLSAFASLVMAPLLAERVSSAAAATNADDALAAALAVLQDERATSEQKAAAEALFAAHPVSLTITGGTLRDAFVQLFAQTEPHLSASVDDALTMPVSLNITGISFGTALTTLMRMARRAGQPVAVAIEAGRLKVTLAARAATSAVVAGARPPASAEEWPVLTADPSRRFQRHMSEAVLLRYISRAVTHYGLCAVYPEKETRFFEDDLRMLTRLGAKFIGRAAYAWVPPTDDEAHFRLAAERAARAHQADPEMILQACVFEAVYEAVNNIPVPPWVFTEFGLPVETRSFRYDAMRYPDDKYKDHWTKGASVPDMASRETQMYFYYRARRYIDAGFESIHFGQVHLMDENDPGHAHWFRLLTRVRRYAAQNARRLMVLCDAHTHGVVIGGQQLLFDLHAWPLMARDVPAGPDASPKRTHLELGYYNCIYRRSLGGVTPSGWACTSLPYICEFDCGGISDKPGQASNFPWNWGWSCGDWFAQQPSDYQKEYLAYADVWLSLLNENAFLQMPTRLNLAQNIRGVKMWQANRRGPACEDGFDLEDAIYAIWKSSRH